MDRFEQSRWSAALAGLVMLGVFGGLFYSFGVRGGDSEDPLFGGGPVADRLTDAERVWCTSHLVEVFLAADSLGLVSPSISAPSDEHFFDQSVDIFEPSDTSDGSDSADGVVSVWEFRAIQHLRSS